MSALRPVFAKCGLVEDLKWGKPCYSNDGKNIVIMQPMKNFLALMFFKGALLADPEGLLEEQGPNSRSARRLCITSVGDVKARTKAIRAFVAEAIAAEEEGREVGPRPELELVGELQRRLHANAPLQAAFAGLTPGRQREYNLFISGAKQATTREARVDKCVEKILDGKGLRDVSR